MRRSSRWLPVAVWVMLAPALGSPTWAQSQSAGGSIEGVVRDESGAVLPGATVTIRNPDTAFARVAETDAVGRFRAPLLPVGRYEVTAALEGFAATRQEGLALQIGQTLVLELTLGAAMAEDSIVVTAEAPVIETTRGSQSSTVNARAIESLPVNGRNFIDFVLTTPGVTRDVRLGDISFAGQRGTLNSVVVDGADNNNTFFGQTLGRTGSGRAPYQFSQDAVQEFQVNRSAYSAEYGRAGGAVINVVTKSGTNAYHGSLFWFYRDKSLTENSFANELAGRPKSPYQFDQYGVSLGGPLVKDRAFFFVSYDAQRNEIPNDIDIDRNLAGLTLPNDADTLAGLAKLRAKGGSWLRGQDQDVVLVKADWNLSSRQRLSARYNWQDFTGTNFENGGATNSSEHTGDSLVQTQTLNAVLSSVFGGSVFNEARAQYAKDDEPGRANSAEPEATVREQGRTILTAGRNFFSPRATNISRWQAADTVTWLTGDHALKAGLDYLQDDIENNFPGNFSGSYTFNSIASYNRGRPSGAGERYVQAFPGFGTTGPVTRPNSEEWAMFAQDEWRPSAALSLTLGLRYDRQKFDQPLVRNPDPQLASAGIDTSFIATDDDNVAPRIGLAWTPRQDVVVRAGYGVYYGRTPAIMVGTAHSNNGINVQTITFTGAQVPTFPGTFPAPPTGASPPKPTIFVFDRGYENPEIQQASAGVEWAASDDLALGASYLWVRGKNLQRSTDLNVGTPVDTAIPIQGGGSLNVLRYPTTRPFSSFDRIIRFESSAESEYNGIVLEARKRWGDNLQAAVAYTYGKVTDTAPDATAVVPNSGDDAKFAPDPAHFDLADGPGNNDQRHRIVFSGVWRLDYSDAESGWEKALLNGWAVSWIASFQSGQPYSKGVTNDLNRDGNTRNDIVPGSRNSVSLPSATTVDLRVSKRIPFGARFAVELIAEAFNLFNEDNINAQRSVFYNYNVASNTLIPVSNFGDDVAAADNRIIQLAAKLTF